ncbi:MAG TPA: ABC transporter substrate-binding protein [Solirubrobacteraceae bacterium]|jgi:branched-chain amino acid transport system substrate-binding protein
MRVLALSAVLVLGVCVAGCGSSKNSSSNGGGKSGQTAASKEPIKIGAVLAQSGLFSEFDIGNTAGVELAAEDINKEGGVDGRKLEVTVGDYKSKPELGGTVARELIGEGATAIITSADFDFGSPAALAAQSSNVVAISAGAEAPEFGVQGIGPLAYTMGTSTNETAAAWAEWIHNKRGAHSVFILEDPTLAYDTTTCENFETAWKEIPGTKILGKQQFKNTDPSISVQITKIQALSEKPEFILLCSYPPGGATALRQLRAAGIETPVIGGDAFSGTAWLASVPKLSNFYYTDYVSVYGDDPNQEVNRIVEEAKAKAHPSNAIAGVTIAAYSAVQAYAKAVETAGTTETKAVEEALNEFNEVPLLVGPTTFTSELHINDKRPLAILEIKNGEGRFVEEFTPAKVPAIKFK